MVDKVDWTRAAKLGRRNIAQRVARCLAVLVPVSTHGQRGIEKAQNTHGTRFVFENERGGTRQ